MSDSLHDRVGRCWSCQHELRASDAVILRENPRVIVPCCRDCWEQIPVAQRLLIADKFRQHESDNLDRANDAEHRKTMIQAIEAAGQAVEGLLHGMIQMYEPGDDGDFWKHSRN